MVAAAHLSVAEFLKCERTFLGESGAEIVRVWLPEGAGPAVRLHYS